MLFEEQAYKSFYFELFVIEFMFVAHCFENFNNHRLINIICNETSLSFLRSLTFFLHNSNSLSLIFFIVQKMIVLFEVLRDRSAEITYNWILIIDKLNKNEIDILIRFLYETFKIRSWHFVRLCTMIIIFLNSSFMNYINIIIH